MLAGKRGFIIVPPFAATSLDGLGWVRMERIVEPPAAGQGGVYDCGGFSLR